MCSFCPYFIIVFFPFFVFPQHVFGESLSYFDLVVSVHIFLPQRKIEYTSSLRNVILVFMLILRRLIPYGIQVYKNCN